MVSEMVKVEIGGVTYVVEDTDIVKYLSTNEQQSVTPISFKDAGVDYQVPAGKTFQILGLAHVGNTAAGHVVTIFQADAADSNTGQVNKAFGGTLATGDYIEYPTPNRPTIAAEKYINADSSNSSSGYWYIIGIESA